MQSHIFGGIQRRLGHSKASASPNPVARFTECDRRGQPRGRSTVYMTAPRWRRRRHHPGPRTDAVSERGCHRGWTHLLGEIGSERLANPRLPIRWSILPTLAPRTSTNHSSWTASAAYTKGEKAMHAATSWPIPPEVNPVSATARVPGKARGHQRGVVKAQGTPHRDSRVAMVSSPICLWNASSIRYDADVW